MKQMVAVCPWMLLTLLLTSGCATIQSHWKDTEAATTIEAYEDFLKRYPTGSFATQAQTRLQVLYWQRAQDTNTIEAYEDFLKRYPKGSVVIQVHERLEPLYWQRAQNTNTIEAYEDFLKRYPKGSLVTEAHAKLEPLYWQKAQVVNTIEAYDNFLTRYPKSLHAEQARRTLAQLRAEIPKKQRAAFGAIKTVKLSTSDVYKGYDGGSYTLRYISESIFNLLVLQRDFDSWYHPAPTGLNGRRAG